MKSIDATGIAKALGKNFRAVVSTKKERGLVQVEHIPSKTLFVAIPGGTFEMGPSKKEALALSKLEFCEEVTREQVDKMIERARPKKTKVAPFLCARAPVLGALAEQVLGEMPSSIVESDPAAGPVRVSAKDAGTLARAFAKDGLRLITEAEWEYVAREGGDAIWINANDAKGAERACEVLYRESRFDRSAGPPATNALGVWGLPWGDFVAEGKGTRRSAWGVRGGAAMLYAWQTDEIVMCVPSFGYRLGKNKETCGVRFALDMP